MADRPERPDREGPRRDRSQGGRSQGGRPQGGRPQGGQPHGRGPRRDGPPSGGPKRGYSSGGYRGGDRARGSGPPSDRSPYGKPPGGHRGRADGPRYDDRQRRPDGQRFEDRPRRDDRPHSDRPRRDDRPFEERPRRPYPPRPYPPRPYGARPQPYQRPHRPATTSAESAGLVGESEELIAGRRPVEEAFAAQREAIRLLIVPERRAALDALAIHATTLRIPVIEVEGGTLTSLAGFDGHQGVALVAQPRPIADTDQILARSRERDEAPFILVLDSLEDPQNFGTLLRSAEAVGAHGVIYPTRRAAPLSPSAIKASAGATEHLVLAPVDDLAGTLADLHGKGLRVVGADEDASLDYAEADLRGPIAIVVGSEGRGISGTVRKRLDLTVRIPMRGKIQSLNASVAGSILLFAAAAGRSPEAAHAPDSSDGAPKAAKPAKQAKDAKSPKPKGTKAATSKARKPGKTKSAEPLSDDGLLPTDT